MIRSFRHASPTWSVTLSALLFVTGAAPADDDRDFFKPKETSKPPAGKSEMLKHVPKKFATFQSADAGGRQVTLLLEGEKEPKTWPINPDAECKIHGWWGRIDQFLTGDRVWVWFDTDRERRPTGVLMLADEISQQDIHGTPPVLETIDPQNYTITVKPAKGAARTLKLPEANGPRPNVGGVSSAASRLPALGEKVFVQSAGEVARLVVTERGLETMRIAQKDALRKRWTDEGLPGTVTFLHRLGGEMDFMLDHEAIRWGRSLKTGDKVRLKTAKPIEAEVKDVRPWRERTQLRLVASGFDLADLSLGQRVHLSMPAPPLEVDQSEMPPDIDRARTKAERIDWFLASTYCSCNVKGDTCTGMFYTLASCNAYACGMPGQIRQRVAGLIDKGMTDRQIFEELKKTQGPLMLKPHLLP